MAKRNNRQCQILQSGALAGKTVVFASATKVEASGDIVPRFMSRIFELEPGDYVVTDESDILDFVPLDERAEGKVWSRIQQQYGVTLADVGSQRLVDIFRAIATRRDTQ